MSALAPRGGYRGWDAVVANLKIEKLIGIVANSPPRGKISLRNSDLPC